MTKRECFQQALDQTLTAYKKLEENPEKYKKRFKEVFGNFTECRFCKVANFTKRKTSLDMCKDCPLDISEGTFILTCIKNSTYKDLDLAFEENDNGLISAAAYYRANYIRFIAHFNGYQV